jgi:hypothetical protein
MLKADHLPSIMLMRMGLREAERIRAQQNDCGDDEKKRSFQCCGFLFAGPEDIRCRSKKSASALYASSQWRCSRKP